MKNKTYEKWLKRVKDVKRPWAENEIIYFRKYVGSAGTKDRDAAYELLYMVEHEHNNKGYPITTEQTKKGINYIYNTAFKRNGNPRHAKRNIFGPFEQSVIKGFTEFRFVGLYRASDNNYDFFTPIYRVIARNGDAFEYTTNMGLMTLVARMPKLTLSRFIKGGAA